AGNEQVASEQFELEVQAAQSKHFSAAWEPIRRIVSAHDQVEADGKVAILVRAAPGDLPEDGSAVRALEPKGKVESLAVAVNVSSPDGAGWFAVLEGGKPGFGRVGVKNLLGWVEGAPLELAA